MMQEMAKKSERRRGDGVMMSERGDGRGDTTSVFHPLSHSLHSLSSQAPRSRRSWARRRKGLRRRSRRSWRRASTRSRRASHRRRRG